jgi:glutathione S-transferase
MKLYFAPGACALGVQIALRESGLKFDLVKVDLAAKTTADGRDFKKVNPKGYVPALEEDNGDILTEGAVILQWIADQVPEKKLLPKLGTKERYHAMEWLNFVSTELHKGLSAFFNKSLNQEARTAMMEKLQLRLTFLNTHLKTHPFVLGSEFSVVDGYIFNIIRWAAPLKVDLSQHSAILGLLEKVGMRPSARAAIEAEGLKN